MMCPTDRYVILRQGVPVATYAKAIEVIMFLWGRDMADEYVVLNYEAAYPWDEANLVAWSKRLPEYQEEGRGWRLCIRLG